MTTQKAVVIMVDSLHEKKITLSLMPPAPPGLIILDIPTMPYERFFEPRIWRIVTEADGTVRLGRRSQLVTEKEMQALR